MPDDSRIKFSRHRGDREWVYTAVDHLGRPMTIVGEVQFGVAPWVCEDGECRAVWWDDQWYQSKCPLCGKGIQSDHLY